MPLVLTEQEYFLSGTATGYQQTGTWGSDGRWSVQPAEQAAYRTRMLVRRPADPARFNRTVIVEWLNVSTVDCALPANDGHERYVMDDALSQLNRWVRTRIPAAPPPRSAPRSSMRCTPAIPVTSSTSPRPP